MLSDRYTKIYVPITDEEFVRLSQAAFRDCRHPREQARHFIRQALGLVTDDGPSLENSKIASVKVATQYAHRNGETTPPTELGYYFFCGDHVYGKASKDNIKDNIKEIVRVTEWGVDIFLSENLLKLDRCLGQWWGPIAPPWETEPNP